MVSVLKFGLENPSIMGRGGGSKASAIVYL